jgi:YD repeat-containing protein
VKKIIDPNNQPTLFEYHATFNRVTKITDALTQITEFTYDNTNGNLLTVSRPRVRRMFSRDPIASFHQNPAALPHRELNSAPL